MKYNVCVVGPRTLVGETLLEVLEERAFPIARLFALDAGEGVAETISFAGEDHTVFDIDDFDFGQSQLAFFCGDSALSREYAPRAAAAGCLVIDDSDAFRGDPDVPLAVPEVTPDVLEHPPRRGIIASPNSCATVLAMTLAPLSRAFGLEAVNVVTFQSVSGLGRAAVEELAEQSLALFNQRGVEPHVFPKQMAFNLLPRIGAEDDTGYSDEERKIVAETRRLLSAPELPVDVTCVRVPVFYGHALVVQVTTRDVPSRQKARAVLDAAPGVVLYDGPGAGDYPTPVVEAATHDPVFVGRLRARAGENPKGLTYWAVVDNMRKGAALNCVQIAEKWVQIRPASPLM